MEHQVALVTGAANGIGKATARAFLEAGVDVVLVDVDEPSLDATAAELGSLGPALVPIVADLSDLDRIDGIMQTAVDRLGRVDHLVNSAAILGGTASLLDLKPEEWERTFRVNLTAPVMLMKAFARHAIERGGGGRIVNVTSASAFRAQHSKPAYGSAKGGLTTLTRIGAAELGQYDINVNAVAPGVTDTPGASFRRGVSREAMLAKVSEGPQANFFKRVSEPEDAAAAIVFLCSPGSRQITGQTVHVSAGAVTP